MLTESTPLHWYIYIHTFQPPFIHTYIQSAKIHFTFLIVVQNSLFLRTFISRKILYGRFSRHPPSYCRIVVFYRLVYTYIICAIVCLCFVSEQRGPLCILHYQHGIKEKYLCHSITILTYTTRWLIYT